MKINKILTVLIAVFFTTQNVLATDFAPFKGTSEINSSNERLKPTKQELIFYPLSFMVSGLELGTEFMVKDKNTLRFSAGYFMSDRAIVYNRLRNTIIFYDVVQMKGFRTEAQYRFYSRNFLAPDNFFLGVYGVYKNVSLLGKIRTGINEEVEFTLKSNAASLGTILGYRGSFLGIFSMDFFLGGGVTPINSGDAFATHVFIFPTKKSINFRAGWTLGIKI